MSIEIFEGNYNKLKFHFTQYSYNINVLAKPGVVLPGRLSGFHLTVLLYSENFIDICN